MLKDHIAVCHRPALTCTDLHLRTACRVDICGHPVTLDLEQHVAAVCKSSVSICEPLLQSVDTSFFWIALQPVRNKRREKLEPPCLCQLVSFVCFVYTNALLS